MNKKKCITLYVISKIIFIISMGLVWGVVSCATTPTTSQNKKQNHTVPSQYLNPSETYPQEQYLASSGSGATLQDAQQNALASLASMIKVDVNSSLLLISSEKVNDTNADSSYESSTTLDNSINTSTDQAFIGVQYGDSYQSDDGLIYTIAFIDRLKVGNIYRENIETNINEINMLTKEANQSDGLKKYALLTQALELAMQNNLQIDQLQVIAPAMASLVQSRVQVTSASISQERVQTAQNITIYINTTVNDENNEIKLSIENNIADLFTELQFSVVRDVEVSNDNSVEVSTQINWDEKPDEKYPSIDWSINISIINNGNIMISDTQEGKSKGKTIGHAKSFALADITDTIHNNTKEAIISQMK